MYLSVFLRLKNLKKRFWSPEVWEFRSYNYGTAGVKKRLSYSDSLFVVIKKYYLVNIIFFTEEKLEPSTPVASIW